MSDGTITISAEIDTKDFTSEINYIYKQMEELENKLKQADMGYEVGDVDKIEAQYSKLSKQLVKLVNKQKELGKTDFSGIKKSINDAGNSIDKVIKKISKWALAVFGIRSAYNMVRQSMSTLTQYDEQLASNVEYMRYAVANALKPVIETIINLAYKLLVYTNYIAKAWFGVDLFANSSAKAFKKAKDGISATNKEAKKLSKQLAGFDEMNVLQDNKSQSGAGGGGTKIPDLPKPEDVPIPGWLKWIVDNKDIILSVIGGIATGIAAFKLVEFIKNSEKLLKIFSGLKDVSSGFLALGIGVAVSGLILLIKDVLDFIKDPSWEKFGEILMDLGLIITGVSIAMLAFNMTNPVGWIMLAVAAIATLVGAIIKYWDQIKAVFLNVVSWINDKVIKPLGKFFSNLWDSIKGTFSGVGNFFKDVFTTAYNNIKKVFSGIKTFFSGIWNSIKSIFSTIGTKIGDAFSSAFKTVINSVLKAAEKTINAPIKLINSALGAINKIPGVEISKITEITFPKLAKGGIVNMPGNGVMIGNAIAGERGAEGVIPLTDSQQMALLGEAIGRYITVNANIVNKMNGKVLSREIQKIQNSNDFATNS